MTDEYLVAQGDTNCIERAVKYLIVELDQASFEEYISSESETSAAAHHY